MTDPTPSVEDWAEWAGISLEIAHEQEYAAFESWSHTLTNWEANGE